LWSDITLGTHTNDHTLTFKLSTGSFYYASLPSIGFPDRQLLRRYQQLQSSCLYCCAVERGYLTGMIFWKLCHGCKGHLTHEALQLSHVACVQSDLQRPTKPMPHHSRQSIDMDRAAEILISHAEMSCLTPEDLAAFGVPAMRCDAPR